MLSFFEVEYTKGSKVVNVALHFGPLVDTIEALAFVCVIFIQLLFNLHPTPVNVITICLGYHFSFGYVQGV